MGRPRKQPPNAFAVMEAAASNVDDDADDSSSEDEDDDDDVSSTDDDDESDDDDEDEEGDGVEESQRNVKRRKRRTGSKNVDWFHTPHIGQILATIRRERSVTKAVRILSLANPPIYSEKLHVSTLHTWFERRSLKDKTFVLKDKYQSAWDIGTSMQFEGGRKAALDPQTRQKIMDFIDSWSVHTSADFRNFMKNDYPLSRPT